MTNPIKLIFAGFVVLLTGCDESDDLKKSAGYDEPIAERSKARSKLESDIPTKFVAGVKPNQRPTGAPVMREFVPDTGWRKRFLAGISNPTPPNLNFINSQGAWYTPFNQPGMPGYYDLRNLHNKARNSSNEGR